MAFSEDISFGSEDFSFGSEMHLVRNSRTEGVPGRFGMTSRSELSYGTPCLVPHVGILVPHV